MAYRLLFFAAGISGFFAVMTGVFLLGRLSDPVNEGWEYVAALSVGFFLVTTGCLLGASAKRKNVQDGLSKLLNSRLSHGKSILASEIAHELNIPLDSVRDLVDSIARRQGWQISDMAGYDACYSSAKKDS